jgi:3-phosphoshikimate 1-carboxyvinyltransferase
VPPLSKSDALRALVLADVTGVEPRSFLPGEALPRDAQVLQQGLAALRAGGGAIDCHDGGAPFRFLLTQAALACGRTTRFTGTARLGERPHAPLFEALRAVIEPLGGRLTAGTPWPVVVEGPRSLAGLERFSVAAAESSQFASSLLLGAARVTAATGRTCAVLVQGPIASAGYLALTEHWLRRAGFAVTAAHPSAWTVAPRAAGTPPPGGAQFALPGDWSSIAFLLLLAWRSGAEVARVGPFGQGTLLLHPDQAVVGHLESVGLAVTRGTAGRVAVTGSPRGGLTVDAAICPDAVPALAALACVLPAPSRFLHAAILRHKESDRLAGLRELADRVGAAARVAGDELAIDPATAPRALAFDARDDHRLAMAAATLAHLAGVPLRLRGGESVAKSFPGFWREAAKVGIAPPS